MLQQNIPFRGWGRYNIAMNQRVRRPTRPVGMLIEGNFSPSRRLKGLQTLSWSLGGFLAVSLLATMIIYGVTVHYQNDVLETARKARMLAETNTSLQVEVNRLQSYQAATVRAQQLSYLQPAQEVLHISPHTVRSVPPAPVSRTSWIQFPLRLGFSPQADAPVYGY